MGSMPTSPAAVVVGIPMLPKVGGATLAIRHATAEKSGSNPRPTMIAAGIATAVPKPALYCPHFTDHHQTVNDQYRDKTTHTLHSNTTLPDRRGGIRLGKTTSETVLGENDL